MFESVALAFFGPIGTTELLIVLFILVLIFGASKLPQLGGAVGKTIKSFKAEMKNTDDEDAASPPEGPNHCPGCGAKVDDPEAKFCSKCGKAFEE